MKIVFTTDTIHRGGKERQLFILTRSLLDKGIIVSIIAKHFSKENYLEEYGLHYNLCFTYLGKTWVDEYNSFKQIVFSQKPDILISWDLQTSLYALMLIGNNNFIFINASIQHGIRLLRFSHILRSIICFFSPYVIANSFAGLRANNLKPGERRFILYNGIEAKFMNKLAKNEIENLRKKLIPGYRKKPGIVYISVANFVPYKDYYTVLKALAQLKDKFLFYYFILGDGPMKEETINTVKNFGLENQIFLIGNTENVSDYLFASDIMIHSSRGEGISNAILEGLYAGLPVIASNVGGISETVYPGSSLLFPYKNDQVLYKCLLDSLKLKASFDPQTDAYQHHLGKFSVTNMVKNFEKILETVMREER